jgi:hypothetical protein
MGYKKIIWKRNIVNIFLFVHSNLPRINIKLVLQAVVRNLHFLFNETGLQIDDINFVSESL